MRHRFSPIEQLFDLETHTAQPHVFSGKSADELIRWQRTTRAKLKSALGFQNLPASGVTRRISRIDRGDHFLSEYHIRVPGEAVMPVFVLEPPGKATDLPCVLALHGHGYGVNDILGRDANGNDRPMPADSYHRDFAVELVRRGFLVAAPEINCFGRRVGDFSALPPNLQPSTCYLAGAIALMLGGTILGLRVRETRQAIDCLFAHPRASRRLGVMGISGGGMLALFTAALDARIRAAVISGYFCSWKDDIQAMQHCLCNYVPGMSQFGDVGDIGKLLAPRPVLIEHGTNDDIMPLQGVNRAIRAAKKAWALFDAKRKFQTDIFPGGHRINGEGAYPFLAEVLKKSSK